MSELRGSHERIPENSFFSMHISNSNSNSNRHAAKIQTHSAQGPHVGWKPFTHSIPKRCRDALRQYFQMAQGIHEASSPDFAIDPPTWKSEMTWTEFCYLPLRLAFHRSALRCKWTYKMAVKCSGGIDPRVFKPCSAALTCAVCKHYVACKNHEYDGLAEVPEELMHNFMEEPLTPEVLRERGHLLGG